MDTDCALSEAQIELLYAINITCIQPAACGRVCIKCELQGLHNNLRSVLLIEILHARPTN